MDKSEAMNDVLLVNKKREAFMKFLAAEKRLERRIRNIRTSISPSFELAAPPSLFDMLPYFLRQPKAKAAHYLKENEEIIVEESGSWEKAVIKTVDHTNYAKGKSSLLITFANCSSGDLTTRYLAPGENWGVLRGEDVHLDFSRMRMKVVATGPQQRVRLVSECQVCTANNILIYPEEREQLQSFLPFSCPHQVPQAAIVEVVDSSIRPDQITWEIPRPIQPREGAERNAEDQSVSASSIMSEVTEGRLEEHHQQALEFYNQAMSYNVDIENKLSDRWVDRLPSPDLPTIGATRAWETSMNERWVDLEARVDRALAEFQRCGDDFECPKSSVRSEGSVASPASLNLDRGEVRVEAETQVVRDPGSNRDDLMVEQEVTGNSGPSPIHASRHYSPLHVPYPLTSFTQVSGVIPRTAPPRPLGQTEDARSSWSFSHDLRRSQTKVEEDWRELQEELREMEAQKCSRAQVSAFLEGVKSLKADFNELLVKHSKEVEGRPKKDQEALSSSYDERWRPVELFIRASRRNAEKSIMPEAKKGEELVRYRQGHLEKISLPAFSGRIDEWASFKKEFEALTQAEGYPEIFTIAKLRDRLPPDAQDLVRGLELLPEIWQRLGERYGDKEQAILHAIHRLSTHNTGQGLGYSRLESLRTAVRTCQASLKAVQATGAALNEVGLIGRLVLKLPETYQYSWHLFKTSNFIPQEEAFSLWLEREGAAANSAHLAQMSADLQKDLHTGARGRGATMSDPFASTLLTGSKVIGRREKLLTQKTSLEFKEELLAKMSPCPCCKEKHHYSRKLNWGTVDWPSNRLESCPVFLAKSPKERAKILEDEGGCAKCTATNHTLKLCFRPDSQVCGETVGSGKCSKPHHRLVHGSSSVYCQANSAVIKASAKGEDHSTSTLQELTLGCLFEHQMVPAQGPSGKSTDALIICDSASNTNFVTFSLAERLDLVGEDIDFYMSVIGEQYCRKRTRMYRVSVIDKMGKPHLINALGVQAITDAMICPNLGEARRLFPSAPQAVFRRAEGPVEILLSMTERHLHANGGEQKGALRLSQTPLGCGWILTGLLPGTRSPPVSLTTEVRAFQTAVRPPPPKVQVFLLDGGDQPPLNFTETEELGYTPPPMCPKCQGCSTCSFRRTKLSAEEREVLAQVEKEMVLDPMKNRLTAKYPWKACIFKMRCNKEQTRKVQEAIEKRQVKDGSRGRYLAELDKMIQLGTIRELSGEEISLWSGPVNYNPMFAVVKEGSLSSKTRIVLNSAQRNRGSGLSLNDCMKKGPDCLASLFDVLVHWRTSEYALMVDLQKAYQAVHTGSGLELHCRRVLCRWDVAESWKTFAYTRATFGDLSAGLLLEVAKRRAATLGSHLNPKAAQQIIDYTYVDDSLLGGTKEEIIKMKGKTADGDDGDVAKILRIGGLKAKFMAISGDPDPLQAIPIGGKVLGLGYLLAEDTITMTIPVSLAGRGSPNSPSQDLEGVKTAVAKIKDGKGTLTKRKVLSFLMATYDPLGLISPALVQGKLLIRRLYGSEAVKWDQVLPQGEQEAWASWFIKVMAGDEASFPRTTILKDKVGEVWIAGFSDASLDAMCAVLYVLWVPKGSSTPLQSSLLVAKCRVTPVHGTSVPRAELQALVICLRLLSSTLQATEAKVRRVVVSVDSQCTLAALQKPGAQMKPYFSNRVAEATLLLSEARAKVGVLDPVQFVPGHLNPSDLGTRGDVGVSQLGAGSTWQKGPSFLLTPRPEWPVNPLVLGNVPQEELRGSYRPLDATRCFATAVTPAPNRLLIALAKNSLLMATSWVRAQGALARTLQALFTGQDFSVHPTTSQRQAAKELQILASSESARGALERGKLLSLGAVVRRGVVMVDGRVRKEVLAMLLGIDCLPVILPQERLAQLVLEDAHAEDHNRDPQSIMARARRSLWIPGGALSAKKIARRCMACRVKNKALAQQMMADLPNEKLSLSAPFQICSLDMFGPFPIKGFGQEPRSLKVWGIIYLCLNTKAVCILACPGYSTECFILTHRKFTSLYTPGSSPARIYCDHGPQMVSTVHNIQWEEIKKKAGWGVTEWIFTPKGCSWRNGACERAIRSARHSLYHVLQKGILLDFHEVDAAFHQVSAIINSRPISVRQTKEDTYIAISPSDLLLGRSARSTANPEDLEPIVDDDIAIDRTASRLEQIVAYWWKAWIVQAMPELVPRRKWMTEHRNLQPGDICHLSFSNKVGPPVFRLCRVTDVYPDHRGMVRTVRIEVRKKEANADGQVVYGGRHTHRLLIGVQRLAVLLPREEQSLSEDTTVPHGDQEGPASNLGDVQEPWEEISIESQ